jgi:hypothetical protein
MFPGKKFREWRMIMTYYYCDGTGKLIEYNPNEVDPSIMHMYKYTFSRDFWLETVQPQLDAALESCGNDMSAFFTKQYEILDKIVQKQSKSKKKKK